jgi:hypothetical protein
MEQVDLCPKDWTWHDDTVPGGILSAPGEIQNVPEFHDCQRFLDTDDTDAYGSHFAIFATSRPGRLDTLDSLIKKDAAGNAAGGPPEQAQGTPPPFSTDDALPSAEIWAPEGDYPALGIKQGFNCLYLYHRGKGQGWHAAMYWLGGVEKPCTEHVRWKWLDSLARHQDTATSPKTVTLLKVNRHPHSDTGSVPKVARWDWDAVKGQETHYIGIYCGNAWCDVGHRGGLSPSNRFLDGFADTNALPKGHRRVYGVKGWYDEQELATAGPNGGPKPSGIRGTLLPDTLLGVRELADFDAKWVQTAEVALTGASADANPYLEKLNLAITPSLETLNRIELCHGSDCLEGTTHPCQDNEDWFARITRADDPTESKFYCVKRCDFSESEFTIPGSVRWRWLEDDEKVWMRCAQGCCEVQGDGFW